MMTDPGHRRGHKTRTARSRQTAEPGVSRGLQSSLPADTLTSDPRPPAVRGDVLLPEPRHGLSHSRPPVASVTAPPPPAPGRGLSHGCPGKSLGRL